MCLCLCVCVPLSLFVWGAHLAWHAPSTTLLEALHSAKCSTKDGVSATIAVGGREGPCAEAGRSSRACPLCPSGAASPNQCEMPPSIFPELRVKSGQRTRHLACLLTVTQAGRVSPITSTWSFFSWRCCWDWTRNPLPQHPPGLLFPIKPRAARSRLQ